ncbi:hypothetical protein L0337_22610 [candidate division KSB1 bacterium]|nr:hypothetical protein [candidate division KSB1 bacterium]
MRKSFSIACLLVMMIGVSIGCDSANKKEETNQSSLQTNAANGGQQSDGKQYQAACTDKQTHGGNDYVLTKWLDSKYKAEVYGKEHERKNKGHVVIYKERITPEQTQP